MAAAPARESPAAPTVAEALAGALVAAGVRRAWGMPGGVLLPLLDALRARGVDFVLVRHEGSAGFAADAEALLTGRPSLLLATLGPGVTNAVSGAAQALLDRTPVVVLTGAVSTAVRDRLTHQVLDHLALLAPVVVRGRAIADPSAIAGLPADLAALASGRPGPVHLDLPGDVARAPAPGPVAAGEATSGEPGAPRPRRRPPAADLAAVGDALDAARRPVVFAGHGDLSDAAATALRRLADGRGVPVVTTYRAKGLYDERGPWSAGAAGLSPVVDRRVRAFLARADLLLCVGLDHAELRPDWVAGWPAGVPVAAVDAWEDPDAWVPAVARAVGDVPATLEVLADGPPTHWRREEVARLRAEVAVPFEDGPDGPATACRAVQAALGPEGILALDVGAHRITASHALRCDRPRALLQSNGLSTMGYGLPAALAARRALPGRPVACLTGDMGLAMVLGELGTAAESGDDLLVVVFADRSLSLIELKQERMGLPNHGVRFGNPDLSRLAEAFGGRGRVVRPAELRGAAEEALAAGGLWILEVPVDAGAYRRQM